MCIIAYVPAGKKIKMETIDIMFEGNPDGAGIMWKPADGGDVQIRKGFMTVKALKKAFKQVPIDCERAIHCRIATAGKVSTECCHPFPVRPKTNMMGKPIDQDSMVFMHNGVISWCNPKGGMKALESDTMVFGSRVLWKYRKFLDDVAMQDLIEEAISSRMLIFRKDADTIMLGHWVEDNGIYYSNGNFRKKTDWKSYYGTGLYGNYGSYSSYNYDTCGSKVATPYANEFDDSEVDNPYYWGFDDIMYGIQLNVTPEKGKKIDVDEVVTEIEDELGFEIVDFNILMNEEKEYLLTVYLLEEIPVVDEIAGYKVLNQEWQTFKEY